MNFFALSGVWIGANQSLAGDLKFTSQELAKIRGLLPRIHNMDLADAPFMAGLNCIGIQFKLEPYNSNLMIITKRRSEGGVFEYDLNTPTQKQVTTCNFDNLVSHIKDWLDCLESDQDFFEQVRMAHAPPILRQSYAAQKLG